MTAVEKVHRIAVDLDLGMVAAAAVGLKYASAELSAMKLLFTHILPPLPLHPSHLTSPASDRRECRASSVPRSAPMPASSSS